MKLAFTLEYDGTSFSGFQRQHNAETIQEKLQALPNEQRQVIAKIYMEGKSHSEVSAEMDLPLGTVKSRVRLAINKLGVQLAPMGGSRD